MFKRVFAILLILIICLGGGANVSAAEAVCLDIKVTCGELTTEFNGYLIDGHTCLRLQDLSAALSGSDCEFSASVDAEGLTAVIYKSISAGETALFKREYGFAPAVQNVSLVIKSGDEEISAEAYVAEGEIFCEIRGLGGILGFEPVWNGENKSIELYSGASLTAEIVFERSSLKLSGKPICLTFDDGPSYASTLRYLKALSAVGGRGTFFVVGERAEYYPELIKAIYDEGSQLGNHSYTHSRLTELSSEEVKREINLTSNAVYAACGAYPYIGRPPYGAINDVIKTAVSIPFFTWSVDTLDWQYRDADYVYEFIMNNAKEGDVVLLHDLYETSAEAVERAVPALAAQGFVFVTIDEMAELKGGYDKVLGYLG